MLKIEKKRFVRSVLTKSDVDFHVVFHYTCPPNMLHLANTTNFEIQVATYLMIHSLEAIRLQFLALTIKCTGNLKNRKRDCPVSIDKSIWYALHLCVVSYI